MWTSWPNRLFRGRNLCAKVSGSLTSREPVLALQLLMRVVPPHLRISQRVTCRVPEPCHSENSRSCAQQDLDENVRQNLTNALPTNNNKHTWTDLPHISPLVDRFEASCALALGWAIPLKKTTRQLSHREHALHKLSGLKMDKAVAAGAALVEKDQVCIVQELECASRTPEWSFIPRQVFVVQQLE